MKAFLFGVIAIVVIGGLGFVGYRYVLGQKSATPNDSFKTEIVTLAGVLKAGKGDDYSYIILSEGKTVGVASQTKNLSSYVGKKVKVTGQYSGTTFYADTIDIQ